jgi:hypothetical protein
MGFKKNKFFLKNFLLLAYQLNISTISSKQYDYEP